MHDPWKDDPQPGWFLAYSGGLFGFVSAAGWYFLKCWWPLSSWAGFNFESLPAVFAHPFLAGVWFLGMLAFSGFGIYIGGLLGGLIGLWRDGLHQPRIPMRGSFALAGAAALVLAHGPIVPAEWGALWVSGARGFCIALLAGGVANGIAGLLARLLMPARTARGIAPAIRPAAAAPAHASFLPRHLAAPLLPPRQPGRK
jgi:hypothetical protein